MSIRTINTSFGESAPNIEASHFAESGRTKDTVIKAYGELYGRESIVFEANEGKEIARALELNDRTRYPITPDWEWDPGFDIVTHRLATWIETSDYITLDKKATEYENIRDGILTFGHITPITYGQLSKAGIHTSHPLGTGKNYGKSAIFIMQTPNVHSGERGGRTGLEKSHQERSSAIEVNHEQASELMSGNPIDILSIYDRKMPDTDTFSYVSPERVLGYIEFTDEKEEKNFIKFTFELRGRFTNERENNMTEQEIIEDFVNKSLRLLDSHQGILTRLTKLARSSNSEELQEHNGQCLTPRGLLYAYGAMCTRHELDSSIQNVIDMHEQGLLSAEQIKENLQALRGIITSFGYTNALKDRGIEILEELLR